jgi:L-histidine N-alpha-methyltransferase
MSTASNVFSTFRPQGVTQFALDVRRGLGRAQKEIHSTYLYDEVGSALFEAITHLAEYGLTRADERLLEAHAPEVVSLMPARAMVAELGSGTGRKTRHILRAMSGGGCKPLYYPIDVSADALASCKKELCSVATVVTLQDTYLDGLRQVTERRRAGQKILLLFLGSTIGNFEPTPAATFLSSVRAALEPEDALLIGADLVKPVEQMLLAYDDPAGVTAAFNLNLLARMNRELGANFCLRDFRHEARYSSEHRRIEMHLRSQKKQTIHIPAADLTVSMQEGETIWTESSHKFVADELAGLAQRCGFTAERQWVDPEWPFAENLWRVPARG